MKVIIKMTDKRDKVIWCIISVHNVENKTSGIEKKFKSIT